MPSLIHKFLAKVRCSLAAEVHTRLAYDHRAEFLLHETLTSQRSGTTTEKIADSEVIVSLTTHGRRIYEVYLAIESIMQGTILPNRIILWLSKDQENTPLPQTLKNQQNRGLEVYFVEDIGPYTKLIPALEAYPDSHIVTIDDDILYPYDTLEMLLAVHVQHPSAICANRVMDIQFDKKGNLTSVPTWPELMDKTRISPLNFFEGVGSVLYPTRCFNDEVLNRDVFRSICPAADDIWLNVMALKDKTPVVPSNSHYHRFPLMINQNIQENALSLTNSFGKKTNNDRQLEAVLNHYHLFYCQK